MTVTRRIVATVNRIDPATAHLLRARDCIPDIARLPAEAVDGDPDEDVSADILGAQMAGSPGRR